TKSGVAPMVAISAALAEALASASSCLARSILARASSARRRPHDLPTRLPSTIDEQSEQTGSPQPAHSPTAKVPHEQRELPYALAERRGWTYLNKPLW